MQDNAKPNQPLGAIGLGENPRAEVFFDELLFFAGGQRLVLVDHALLAVAVAEGVVNRRRLHVQRQFLQPAPVGMG